MKLTKKIIVLLLALTLAFALFACGGTDNNTCTSHTDANKDGKCDTCGAAVEIEDGGNTEEENSPIALIKDGKINFQFVRASNSSGDVMMLLNSLKMQISGMGGTLNVVEDKVENEQDIEILIGDVTSRGEKYTFDKYSLGVEGYIVKQIGNKIIINAGSDATLRKTVSKFIEDVLGIKSSTKTLSDATMTADNNKLEIQDNYRITAVKINDAEIHGYTIAYDHENSAHITAARDLQDFLYTKTGYYLPLVTLEEANKSIIVRAVDDAGTEGFRAMSDDAGNFIIECAYSNAFEKAFASFLNNELRLKEGEINFNSSYKYTDTVSVVYYEDFGAKGDGYTDDYLAIKATHDYANQCGQTVKAKNRTYYIKNLVIEGAKEGSPITIKTNVDWGSAKFIIDDTGLMGSNDKNNVHIFQIVSDYSGERLSEEEVARLFPNGVDADSLTKLDFERPYKSLLLVYDDNHYNYIRYGGDANDGSPQVELIVLDEQGNIDPTTRFLLDYDQVTRVTCRRLDDKPITIKGGTFTTRSATYVNRDESGAYKGTYYSRGISITRSNVVLDGIKHYITGEVPNAPGDSVKGPSYGGFFSSGTASDVTIQNCVLTAHRYYKICGTYDFGASYTNNIVLKNCTQSNYYILDENGKPTTTNSMSGSMYWGVGGTNYCKNMVYDSCELTRFDAHCGLYNGKIINSKVTAINLIGGGEMLIENCKIELINSNVINLRSDYGATWQGVITIKDCEISTTRSEIVIASGSWVNHDFGYICHVPSLILSGLTYTNPNLPIYIYNNAICTTNTNMYLPTLADGTKNNNVLAAPAFVKVLDTKGYTYTFLNSTHPYFKNTVIEGDIVFK